MNQAHELLTLAFEQWSKNPQALTANQAKLLFDCGLDLNGYGQAINQQAIQSAIDFSHIEVVCSTDSTQKRVKPNSTLIAEHQTQGQGQQGRAWITPMAASICLSHRFKLHTTIHQMPGFTLAMAWAVAQTVAAFEGSGRVTIKWPNDLYHNDAKCAGILTDVTAQGDWVEVTLGIGINWSLTDQQQAEVDRPVSNLPIDVERVNRTDFIIQLLKQCRHNAQVFSAEGFAAWVDQWPSKDHLFGQEIRIDDGQNIHTGQALGVTHQGHLILETASGRRTFNSGTILLSQDGSTSV